jgi:hypothetical protein
LPDDFFSGMAVLDMNQLGYDWFGKSVSWKTFACGPPTSFRSDFCSAGAGHWFDIKRSSPVLLTTDSDEIRNQKFGDWTLDVQDDEEKK